MKVKILKGTCGAFRMAYFAGMEAELPNEQAKLLIEAGYAEEIVNKEEKEINLVIAEIETATAKVEKEVPEKKRRK